MQSQFRPKLTCSVMQQQDSPQQESIIPRIWRSTQKRPLSAESDADIRSIPDISNSTKASPAKLAKPSASQTNGLAKSPDSKQPVAATAKGTQSADSECLIRAHAGGQLSDCRDSMCEGTAVTSTFISLGDVLRGRSLSDASSIAVQPKGACPAAQGTLPLTCKTCSEYLLGTMYGKKSLPVK